MDKLEEVPLREDCPYRCVKISAELKDPLRGQILALIWKYADIFSWTTQDMSRVDPEVMMHRLGIRPGFRSVKQKKQSFALERARAIEAEVEKLMEAQYI